MKAVIQNKILCLFPLGTGVRLFELFVVLAVTALVANFAALSFKKLNTPLKAGAALLLGFTKQVRAEAISGDVAYVIRPVSPSRIISEFSIKCSDAGKTIDSSMSLDMPQGAFLKSTAWSICFDPRGLPDGNVDIELSDTAGSKRTVEIMADGEARARPGGELAGVDENWKKITYRYSGSGFGQ